MLYFQYMISAYEYQIRVILAIDDMGRVMLYFQYMISAYEYQLTELEYHSCFVCVILLSSRNMERCAAYVFVLAA